MPESVSRTQLTRLHTPDCTRHTPDCTRRVAHAVSRIPLAASTSLIPLCANRTPASQGLLRTPRALPAVQGLVTETCYGDSLRRLVTETHYGDYSRRLATEMHYGDCPRPPGPKTTSRRGWPWMDAADRKRTPPATKHTTRTTKHMTHTAQRTTRAAHRGCHPWVNIVRHKTQSALRKAITRNACRRPCAAEL